MSRGEIEKQEPKERQALADGNSPEVPRPGPKFKAISCRDWGDNDGQIHGHIGYHNTNVSPFVRQQFWQSKCSHLVLLELVTGHKCRVYTETNLAIGTSKARNCQTSDDLLVRFGRRHDNMANETELFD